MMGIQPANRGGLAARIEVLRAQPIVQSFMVYFLVGGACALIDIALFWPVWKLTGFLYGAFAFSFVCSTAANYYLSVRHVFVRTRRSREQAVLLVYIASAIAVAVNLAVFSGLVELLGIHPVLAKVASIGIGFGWNFGSRYFWIFPR